MVVFIDSIPRKLENGKVKCKAMASKKTPSFELSRTWGRSCVKMSVEFRFWG